MRGNKEFFFLSRLATHGRNMADGSGMCGLHILLLILCYSTTFSSSSLAKCNCKLPRNDTLMFSGIRCSQYAGIFVKLPHQPYSRNRSKAYFGLRSPYYSNTTATTQYALLKLSGNVESNPGPAKENNSAGNLYRLWEGNSKEPRWRPLYGSVC